MARKKRRDKFLEGREEDLKNLKNSIRYLLNGVILFCSLFFLSTKLNSCVCSRRVFSRFFIPSQLARQKACLHGRLKKCSEDKVKVSRVINQPPGNLKSVSSNYPNQTEEERRRRAKINQSVAAFER